MFPQQTTATFYISSLLLFCGLTAICWTAVNTYALTTGPPDVRPNLVSWLLFVLPTSMNAAWMSVASCLGLNVLAVSQGLPAHQELILAAVLAVIVAAVGAYVILTRRDVTWGLVLIWAFVAVLRAHPHVELIRKLSVVAIGVAGLCSGYVILLHRQTRLRGWSRSSRQRDDEAATMREALLGGGGETGEHGAAAGPSGVATGHAST